jgi:rare lipoprotein A
LSRSLWLPFWASIVMFACLAFGAERAEADTVLASWYGSELAGSPTASGEPYDPSGYTAAHKSLPLGTELVVSYGGSSVQVTVNDRGPYIPGRELDLSQGAAQAIGLDQAGVDYVDYSYANPSVAYGAASQPAAEPSYAESTYSEPYVEPVQAPSVETQPAVDTTGVTQTAGAAEGSGGAYVVQQGQTLTGIAAELGTSVEALAAANGILDPNVIFSGQTLYY